ncbi:protein farnesyltransferase [Cordyceps militaris CM01]|uniref:Protein farnesyltransferase/geranylgeranyltransferase type-1 subunit alpha n=1 Tax=Cordyceps militaris (strain CM01) TaxID=983644 RepID=G3JP73_CORMM|nr:protein farnesyltransferase [Cordyceps militaris CM01]EGX89683.1 protein farnesyltransferase [Cordyceps militaris CM01]
MPPKPKGTAKPTNNPQEPPPQQQTTTTTAGRPTTVAERTQQRFHASNPLAARVRSAGLSSLTAAEKRTFVHAQLVAPVAQQRVPLGNKAEREFWKAVNKEALPIRRADEAYVWGPDKAGRDVGTYALAEHAARTAKQARLTALRLLSQRFRTKRDLAAQQHSAAELLTTKDIEEEKTRRNEMAALNRELYGEIIGALAGDPEWDDVAPILHEEPDNALARIAYPDDYAEAVAYLRAVMADKEYSPRTLRLTALVIALNPAHYTVWLYRFRIVQALRLSIPDEIAWLNEVALENLKNYQIWHHRQLLLEELLATTTVATAALGRSEAAFVATMLAQDSKNYHVWSYRQNMVRRLGLWADAEELASTERLIDDDVRNNSAWSHRFFLVFQDPAASTAGCGPAQHDPLVPAAVIARELAYVKDKMHAAPQNQAPWNYLRAVLAKGGRALASERALAEGLVAGLGTDAERVQSSHALDYLADVYAETGETDKAKVCLQRLGEKWDPIREGYWKHRAQQLV